MGPVAPTAADWNRLPVKRSDNTGF